MRLTRIFTGDDGESHFQDLEVPMTERPYGFLTDWLPVQLGHGDLEVLEMRLAVVPGEDSGQAHGPR